MKDFHSRLEYFLEKEGITKQQFELKLGVSGGLMGRHLIKKTFPGGEILIKMSEIYTNLNWNWLMKGEGEMLLNPNLEKILSNYNIGQDPDNEINEAKVDYKTLQFKVIKLEQEREKDLQTIRYLAATLDSLSGQEKRKTA